MAIIDLLTKIPEKDVKHRYVLDIFHKETYKGDDYIIVNERILTKDNKILPNLRIYKNPKRTFYITKPPYRNHNYKKELEDIKRLDTYICPSNELIIRLKEALNVYSKNIRLSQLTKNPYVYGADIDIHSLIKMSYFSKIENKQPYTPNIATMDIEGHTLTKEIILLSYTFNWTTYLLINDEYFYEWKKSKDGKETKIKLDIKDVEILNKQVYEETLNSLNKKARDLVLANKPKFKFILCKNEEHLINTYFKIVRETVPDFICLWNMTYDIQEIARAIKERLNKDPKDYFSHHKLPSALKTFKFKEDKVKRDHYALKWHYVEAPNTHTYIDLYNLYVWNRRLQPKQSDYKLGTVLNDEIGVGKAFEIDNHSIWQRYHMLKYSVYNIYDSFNLYIMEQLNKDILYLTIVCSLIPIKKFSHTTIKLRNLYYYFYKKKGKIISSADMDSLKEFEKLLKNAGGAVLRPEKSLEAGECILKENKLLKTFLHFFVNDLDFSSIYPTVVRVFNISNTTHLLTPYKIKGFKTNDIYEYFSCLNGLNENSVYLCNKYFNLPNYDEIFDKFNSFIKGEINV